ncbi:hypothetical protein D6T65_05085 [Arthrobacter frigidicola]|nr:hypothetical protein D6T65_05085 [Arthrobacter frigidicola]
MRIRSIKPEFWRSEDITTLDWDDRLIFIGLWSYVDDNGVGMDRLASITADLFAGDLERESSETFARVSRGLQNLFEAGRISRYTVDGKKYLHITNWSKHQRIDKPNKERYPLPTCDDAQTEPQNATLSRQSRESPATGTGEQGNRGAEEPTPLSDKSDEFDRWYAVYPKKEAKTAARKAFIKARKTVPFETLIEAAANYAQATAAKERQFIALPATWLNAGRWEDEISQERPLTTSEQRMRDNLIASRQWTPTIIPEDVFSRKVIGA